MPIIRDGKSLVGGQRNGKALKAVYRGDKQVWSAAPPFTPHLVSVTTPGPFSVPWPAGATKVDRVLCGGGGGGSTRAISAYPDTGSGGATTATVGGDTLTADGGLGDQSPATRGFPGLPGESADDITFNDRNYPGGDGGPPVTEFIFGVNADGFPGEQPGGGGSGALDGQVGATGVPGKAGLWAYDTVTKPPGESEITGSVGAGGNGATTQAPPDGNGGRGGDGIAHFWFYT